MHASIHICKLVDIFHFMLIFVIDIVIIHIVKYGWFVLGCWILNALFVSFYYSTMYDVRYIECIIIITRCVRNGKMKTFT